MNNSPLEFLAKKYGNIVKYDNSGNVVGIFVKFMKCKSSDLIDGLPEHTHPAFIINGVEQDYILLGKYKAAGNGVENGALLSLPNLMPVRSLGADQCLTRMKLAGPNITGMTCADYGFIKLLAQKEGWVPKGNTLWGQSHKDASNWAVNQTITVSAVRAFEGWKYTALIAHTTSVELRPDLSPNYWKKGDFIGGISQDMGMYATTQTGYRTLNGTGPMDWYLGNDLGSISDIIGSNLEQQYGYRIVDCELQFLENNNAAAPDADLSATSAAWKAILPNTSNDGYTLVAPGTAGTLHWTWANSKITLDTVAPVFDSQYRGTNFKDLAVNSANLPYVPHIIKELGLFPTSSADQTEGYYYVYMGTGERFPCRGGDYSNGSSAGLGYVYSGGERGYTNPSYGCRPRSF